MAGVRSLAVAAIAIGFAVCPLSAQESKQQTAQTDEELPVTALTEQERKPDWQIKPRGRLQYDAANIDGPAGLPGQGGSSEIRRAQLGVDIQMPGGFSARLEGEFTADPLELVDAYVAWNGNDFNITAGQQKTFDGLDDATSDLNTSFTERAAFVTAFNFSRGTGVSAGFASSKFLINGGLFTDPVILLNDVRSNSISVDIRAVWMPTTGTASLHFATGYHWRDRKDFATEPVRYGQRPFPQSADTRYITTPALGIDKEQSYGFEAAAVVARFHVATEIYWMRAERPGLPDLNFIGGYGEAGFFLTHDSRPLEGGAFGSIKPARPLGGGGFGAVQINVRYDYLDLNSGDVKGGKQNGYLASIIWTPIEDLRLLINYARLDYSNAVIAVSGARNYSVDVWGIRSQINF